MKEQETIGDVLGRWGRVLVVVLTAGMVIPKKKPKPQRKGNLVSYVRTAEEVIDPIRDYPAIRPRLKEIAVELKRLDGEHWAVGEMLHRACIYLDACEQSALD